MILQGDRAGEGEFGLERQQSLTLVDAESSAKYTHHTRQRSASCSATYYSSAIVPANAPPNAQVLSTLISSLTAFHDQSKLQQPLSQRDSIFDDSAADQLINTVAINSDLQNNFYSDQPPDAENEDGSAPAPVAGYTTLPLSRPRTPISDRWASTKFLKRARQDWRQTKSSWSLRQSDTFSYSPRDIGTPSIERPFDAFDKSSTFPVEREKIRSKSPFKMLFASRHNDEHVLHIRSSTSRSSFQGTTAGESLSSMDREKDLDGHKGTVSSGPSRRQSTASDALTNDSRPPVTLSPSNRDDLDDHLIPSRRSSLRLSTSRTKRLSSGSKDIKSLNIDPDLVEGDDSTVRRIRELQRAKEQRHTEWRKEARRSEKHSKRMSAPHNPSTVKHGDHFRSSWHPKPVAEQPKQESVPAMAARVDPSDPFDMPAFVEADEAQEPLTPVDIQEPITPVDPTSELKRNPSISLSTTQSLSTSNKHRKRLSDSFKKSNSVRRPAAEDAQMIADEVEAFLSAPRLTQKIRHPRTGRTIAFSEVGDPDGFVVFCCVGMGLTRYVSSFYDELAKTQKLRLLTPDRPGVGESQASPDNIRTPLNWADDVAVICSSLGIENFSLLAHSAGAIYALAVALKMPQFVRGRIHLLAPWVPPSQLAAPSVSGEIKAVNRPTSHKILSLLPTSLMKAANSRFLVATSASIEPRAKSDRKKDRNSVADLVLDSDLFNSESSLTVADMDPSSMLPTPETTPTKKNPVSDGEKSINRGFVRSPPISPTPGSDHWRSTLSPSPHQRRTTTPNPVVLTPQARAKLFNATLTHRTWALATLNANPAIDLIVCFERRRPVGFRYTDVGRAVVIHHGEKDNRVPLENVKWLSTAMKRCELRVLENEGHGLMANATVMSNVLAEIGKEWEEWDVLTRAQEKKKREQQEAEQKQRERDMRRGRW